MPYIKLICIILVFALFRFSHLEGVKRNLLSQIDISERLGIKVGYFPRPNKVVIAVIDTGIDLSDKELVSKIYKVDNKPLIIDLTGGDGDDDHGHGTQMAQVIVSIFPHAQIIPIKVFSKKSSNSGLISKAIYMATLLPVDVINLSGGGRAPEGSDKEKEAILEAARKNIVVVAASGNNAENLEVEKFYPASLNTDGSFITVSNDNKGRLHSNSNYGSNVVDLGVEGTEIPVKYKGKIVKTTGTSASAAVTSSIVAIMKANRKDISIKEIKESLCQRSVPNLLTRCGSLKISTVLKDMDYQPHITARYP